MTAHDSTTTTTPCPYCTHGQLQQHTTGAGQLQHPLHHVDGYAVYDLQRTPDVMLPDVIWTCNSCECCARDEDVQHAIGGAR